MPFYLLPHTDFFGSSNNVLKLFRLIGSARSSGSCARRASSRRSTASSRSSRTAQIRVDEGIVALSKLSLTVIVSAHWMGCINWMICREFDFPEDSWVRARARVRVRRGPVQLVLLQGALADVTLSYKDGAPVASTTCVARAGDEGRAPSAWCTIERWITSARASRRSVLYAVLISNVSSIVYNLNMGQRTLHEKVTQVNEYMRSKQLPVEIRDKVRDYYRLRFSGKMYHEADILKELSPGLRDILRFSSKELFKKVRCSASSSPFGAKLTKRCCRTCTSRTSAFFSRTRAATQCISFTRSWKFVKVQEERQA